MLRLAACLIAAVFPFAAHASGVCEAAAKEIDASLRAFEAPAHVTHPGDCISIANAAAQHPAAGLDFGSRLDEGGLNDFPLAEQERRSFDNAMRLVYRAGGAGGLAMLDALAGTAHCHNPFLFTAGFGSAKPLKVPDPADPFELCMYGGVALGAAGEVPFYAETNDNYLEADELKVFPLKDGALSEACTITASYQIVYETAESFCSGPGLCQDYAQKVSHWAERLRSFDSIDVPALTKVAGGPVAQADPGELPLFGSEQSRLVPEPFRFDGSEAWYAVKDDPRVDFLRIGPAHDGPRMMANWESFTLAILYKEGHAAASFVIEKRRGVYQNLATYEKIGAGTTPAALVAAIYRTAAGMAGDYSAGPSIFAEARGREHYLSERLRAALDEMDKRTPKGDVPDLDFDPVTGSQDPVVSGLKIATKTGSAVEATVDADFQRGGNSEDVLLRYMLVRENGAWKVDDIVALRPRHWRVGEIVKAH